jgi:hypothetical protein
VKRGRTDHSSSLRRELSAVPEGFGLAYVPEDLVESHLTQGRTYRILKAGIVSGASAPACSEVPHEIDARSRVV